MQNDTLKVDTSELRQLASNLDAQREELIKIFNTIIKPVLESSKVCIDVSGVDFDQVGALFVDIFNNVNSKVSNLSNVLTTKIIPNYENITNNITNNN